MIRGPLLIAAFIIATAALAVGFSTAIAERRGDERIAAFVHRTPGCFVYRHIDRVDSAYFEVGCRKPLPDSLILVPWQAP